MRASDDLHSSAPIRSVESEHPILWLLYGVAIVAGMVLPLAIWSAQ